MTNTPNPVILDPAKLKTGNGDPAPRDVPTLGLSHYYPRAPACSRLSLVCQVCGR